MEKLPNELMEKIFDDIDEKDKKPVREVCTKWYDMNPMETMVIKYKNDDQERIINDILKIKPKNLVFSYCHDVPGRVINN
jgi:predicted transcriptional regulator